MPFWRKGRRNSRGGSAGYNARPRRAGVLVAMNGSAEGSPVYHAPTSGHYSISIGNS